MEKYFVITLLSVLLFSCSNTENKETVETTSTSAPKNIAEKINPIDDHTGHNHAEGTPHKDSRLSPYIGIWDYFASTHDPKYYKDRWIELKGDGTFENGIGGKQTNSGTWSLEGNNIINFDFKDNSVEKDEQWKTQCNPPVLLLLGNSPKNTTGAQIKLDLVEQRPVD